MAISDSARLNPAQAHQAKSARLDDAIRCTSQGHHDRQATPEMQEQAMEDELQWMLSQLSAEELEIAARSSFEYFKMRTRKDPAADEDDGDDEDTLDPEPYAKKMAERYWKSKKGDSELALEKMRATLAFRKEIDIDSLRLAFTQQTSDDDLDSSTLEKFLSSGKNFVMCHDKEGRSTHFFVPRNTVEHDAEWTLKESLYTMERAIASSRAPDQSVNAILDFRGFSVVYHTPPLSIGKEFLMTLRNHYAGQVHRIFLVDAPASFSWLWSIFSPFVGTSTRDKIIFVSGTTEKQAVFSQYYEPNEATEWMMPESKEETGKNADFDLVEYLYKTPFDKAFDES